MCLSRAHNRIYSDMRILVMFIGQYMPTTYSDAEQMIFSVLRGKIKSIRDNTSTSVNNASRTLYMVCILSCCRTRPSSSSSSRHGLPRIERCSTFPMHFSTSKRSASLSTYLPHRLVSISHSHLGIRGAFAIHPAHCILILDHYHRVALLHVQSTGLIGGLSMVALNASSK